MNDQIYKETVLEFERKKSLKEADLNRKRTELYKKLPRLKKIAFELNKLGLELTKSLISADDKDEVIREFEEKTFDLNKEKSKILTEAGYPPDYLEPKYDCPMCKDTGFYKDTVCSCFTKTLIYKYYKQSNLNEILNTENFDNFNINYYDQNSDKFEVSPRLNMENILLKAINFVNNFDQQYLNLYFYGNSGLGKTYLSHCIAKELLEKGKSVIYQTAADLVDGIRKNKFNNSAHDNLINYLYQCDLLIIDDLGTENLTEFANNELFNLINKRIMSKKSHVISTNLSLSELQKRYSTRLTSRIVGNFTFLKFVGDDIRFKKAKLL